MTRTRPRAHEQEREGASAVEYGLLVAAIAAIIVLIVFALGGVVKGTFNKTCDTIASKTAPTPDFLP